MRCQLRDSWCVYCVEGKCYYTYVRDESSHEPSEGVCRGEPSLFGRSTIDEMMLVRVYTNEQIRQEMQMMEYIIGNVVARDERDRISVAETEQMKELCGQFLAQLKGEEGRRKEGIRWTQPLRELWL